MDWCGALLAIEIALALLAVGLIIGTGPLAGHTSWSRSPRYRRTLYGAIVLIAVGAATGVFLDCG